MRTAKTIVLLFIAMSLGKIYAADVDLDEWKLNRDLYGAEKIRPLFECPLFSNPLDPEEGETYAFLDEKSGEIKDYLDPDVQIIALPLQKKQKRKRQGGPDEPNPGNMQPAKAIKLQIPPAAPEQQADLQGTGLQQQAPLQQQAVSQQLALLQQQWTAFVEQSALEQLALLRQLGAYQQQQCAALFQLLATTQQQAPLPQVAAVQPATNTAPEIKNALKCRNEGCGKRFKNSAILKRHTAAHCSDERPFQCDAQGCNLRFMQMSVLKRHKVVHTGARDFWCEICGPETRFTQKANLKRHLKRQHFNN